MALTLLLSSAIQGVDARATPQGPSLLTRQTTLGFTLVTEGMLGGLGLATVCEQVLNQQIKCDAFVSTLGKKAYHGSLGDAAFTDVVCAGSCSTALTTARRRIAGSCASTPDLFPGYPVLNLIDSIIAGWNETCLKDPTTGEYCNDVIEAFDPVDDIAALPEEQLCSYCYGAKLGGMQGSPYSAYDEYHAETLKYINENCDASHPTDPQDPPPFPDPDPGEPKPTCAGETYTTLAGDTCDSIAQASSVSAATLYYINPALHDCADIPAGKELCLPPTCDTYTVQSQNETCVVIAVEHHTTWQNIATWNSGLDSRCTNLWSEDPFWGRVICVSGPGGVTNGGEEGGGDGGEGGGATPGNGGSGGQGGSGDGYANQVVEPPSGATVADGTTLKCGEFIRAEEGVGCAKMIVRAVVPMDLFLAANPSLGTAASCTSDLVAGSWYCLHPARGFDQGEFEPPREDWEDWEDWMGRED